MSFLKAAAYQDAHGANSDPLDEQQFIVNTINKLQKSPDWKSTAVVIAYDDSDGWYDHVAPKITRLLGRRGRRPGRVRQGPGGRWLPGPLWSEPAPAAARHLAVLQGQFR
ncbi:MAG TPA: alkaline phosphatase family protein [Actinoallomurus sp.]|nr:alkaline phosphatase family protein [Actinoallomurus sp.]